jgi:hypothetical protein
MAGSRKVKKKKVVLCPAFCCFVGCHCCLALASGSQSGSSWLRAWLLLLLLLLLLAA